MKIIFLYSLAMIVTSCNDTQPKNLIPEIFKTNYDKYKDKKLAFNFGDLVQINNTSYKGIICDLSEDEMGIWYGILYMDSNNNLFSRNIPSGLSEDCIKLFDVTYLNYKGQNSIKKISNIKLDFNKIGIGSKSAAKNERELIRDYLRGIDKRKTKETPCDEKKKMLEPINESYRSLTEIEF